VSGSSKLDPFSALDFRVEILLPGAQAPLCDAAFASCDGLELRLDVRALREGGDIARQRLLAGPASYGEITLRRGMTGSFDLWDWCALTMRDPGVRADARVLVLAPGGDEVRATFLLERCLPVRLKAPRLDAVDGVVAIEELRLACELVTLDRPGRKPPPRPKARAELVELDRTHERELDHRVALPCNPARLRITREEDGRATLQFALAFDAGAEDDVRRLTVPIARFTGLEAVRFRWGALRFDGRVTACDEELDLFGIDGRPMRAELALTLREDQPTRRLPT
jgi:phage tail-like protein